MNLANLVDLVHNAGHGIKAKTLFMQMMPADAKNAILIRSPLAGTKINYMLPGFFFGEFQVIVRTLATEDGAAIMADVINDLTLVEATLGNQFFNYCRPRTQPVAFPLSKGNLVEQTVQFDCCFVES